MLAEQTGSRPRVSIAMASFNGERFIRDQLDSLAAQTLLPYELIVTDDGSSDRTLEIIEVFAVTAPFPVFIFRNSRRLGYGANFLSAVRYCRGELVAFCDQDDVWMPEKIERCVAVFSDQETMLCVHTSRLWHGAGEFGDKLHEFLGKTTASPLDLNPLHSYPGFAMMFRRSLLALCDAATRPFSIFHRAPALMAHDQWAWLLACVFGNVGLLPDVLSLYRQHDSNVSGGPRAMNAAEILSRSAATVDYYQFALIGDQCVKLFGEISGICDLQKARANRAVVYFKKFAALHRSRAKIYAASSGLTDRFSAYFSILGSHGYLGSHSGPTLGWRALLKDLLYGVPGFHTQSPAPVVPEAEDGAGG